MLHAMEVLGGGEVQLLTSALDGSECLSHALPSGKGLIGYEAGWTSEPVWTQWLE